MPLAKADQPSFGSGVFRNGPRDRIPRDGAFALVNHLLTNTGDGVRRGGTEYLTDTAFGTGLTFLWDGILKGRRRTIVASPQNFGKVNADGSITDLGGAGLQHPVKPALFREKLFFPRGVTYDGTALGASNKFADVYAAGGERLLAMIGNRAYMTTTGSATEWTDPETGVESYHELPEGAKILAAEGARDRMALFTTRGVWLISNLELDLVDEFGNVQQGLDVFSRELLSVGGAGIASFQDGIVVPAVDGIWLMAVGQDAASAPPPLTKISRPITDLYADYMRHGLRPGGAIVHRDHYLLPILSGARVVDLLVCKLDRVIDGAGSRAWTQLAGHGAQVSMFAVRTGVSQRKPVLLGALRGTTAKVVRARYFENDASVLDADGSTPLWETVPRDYVISGAHTKSLAKKLRVQMVLTDPAAVNPTLTAEYALEEPVETIAQTWGGTTWGASVWAAPVETWTAISGSAAEDTTGAHTAVFPILKNAERIRLRLRCDDATTKARLRSLELNIRPTGRF